MSFYSGSLEHNQKRFVEKCIDTQMFAWIVGVLQEDAEKLRKELHNGKLNFMVICTYGRYGMVNCMI